MKKTCTKCRNEKSSSLFSRDRNSKDGLMAQCSQCNRERAKAHYIQRAGTEATRNKATNTLYEYIQRLHKKNWTLKQIAAEVGLDESSISYYLAGKRQVGMRAVKQCMRAVKQYKNQKRS